MLGEKVSSPIAIAPSALHALAHPDGECATAQGILKKHDTVLLIEFKSTKRLLRH
jgi:isopentenyl diphosphate isomerase/L-lactate dehydrogenase-like FMN-dependent dehydrogenase